MMRLAGWILFAGGLMPAVFYSVEQLGRVGWQRYLASLVAVLAGALLLRLTTHRPAGMLILNVQVIRSSLTMVTAKLKNLDAKKRAELGVFGIHHFIDAHLKADVERFLAARETLTWRHGLVVYGRVMDAVAAGERALNRAWSASADGYQDEVDACLDRARDSFARALALVEQAEKESSTGAGGGQTEEGA
jgi:hypothetical protein